MRSAVVLALLAAACGPPSGSECEQDSECGGGSVCARNGECLPASAVQSVRITWTVRGQTASVSTCGSTQDLYLQFFGFAANDTFGYEPVPCSAGLFSIDKLPDRYNSVEIGDINRRFRDEKVIDSQGNVSFDLAP
jgi:hypothetical protein